MTLPRPNVSAAQRKRVLHIIWMAMTGTIAVYGVINHVVGSAIETTSSGRLFVQILLGIALLTYVLAWWWHRWTVTAVAAQASASTLQRLSVQERLTLQSRLQASSIICCSFLESAAIYGLINTFVGAPLPHLFEGLAAGSVAGFIILRMRGFPVVFELLDRLEVRESGVGR